MKQQKVIEKISENIGKEGKAGITKAIIDTGLYSESYAKSGQMLRTKAWNELMEQHLPDADLLQTHKELLNSGRLDHMVFPVAVTDEEIKELLESVGCTVRKIKHGEQANHAYFWAPDNLARDRALDKGYKLKKRYDNSITVKGSIGNLSDEEIEDRISGILSGIVSTLAGEAQEGTE